MSFIDRHPKPFFFDHFNFNITFTVEYIIPNNIVTAKTI
jgi:hypothetical protein